MWVSSSRLLNLSWWKLKQWDIKHKHSNRMGTWRGRARLSLGKFNVPEDKNRAPGRKSAGFTGCRLSDCAQVTSVLWANVQVSLVYSGKLAAICRPGAFFDGSDGADQSMSHLLFRSVLSEGCLLQVSPKTSLQTSPPWSRPHFHPVFSSSLAALLWKLLKLWTLTVHPPSLTPPLEGRDSVSAKAGKALPAHLPLS